jgi:hypothetical protein
MASIEPSDAFTKLRHWWQVIESYGGPNAEYWLIGFFASMVALPLGVWPLVKKRLDPGTSQQTAPIPPDPSPKPMTFMAGNDVGSVSVNDVEFAGGPKVFDVKSIKSLAIDNSVMKVPEPQLDDSRDYLIEGERIDGLSIKNTKIEADRIVKGKHISGMRMEGVYIRGSARRPNEPKDDKEKK